MPEGPAVSVAAPAGPDISPRVPPGYEDGDSEDFDEFSDPTLIRFDKFEE